MAEEQEEPAETAVDSDVRPILRDEHGRLMPGTRCNSPATAFKPGNPGGGRPLGVVAALHRYIEGQRSIPADWEAALPADVWTVLREDGIAEALALSVLSIALNPEVDPKHRLVAIKWVTDRVDGPIVKKLSSLSASIQRREIVIVGKIPGDEEDPPFPPEVTDIEELEEKARAEANRRRQEALGMEKSIEPPKGKRRRRRPGGNGSNGGTDG